MLNGQEREPKKNSNVLKVCALFLSKIAPRKKHACSKRMKEQFADCVIRGSVMSGSENSVQLSNIRGKKTRMTLGKQPSFSNNAISPQEILQWKADFNLSLTIS